MAGAERARFRPRQGALKEWLRLLALIDQVRTFAVLNVLAVVKLAQRHCSATMAAEIMGSVAALPLYEMRAVGDVMAKMESSAKRLALCLHKDYAWRNPLSSSSSSSDLDLDSASHWSFHICPFCAKRCAAHLPPHCHPPALGSACAPLLSLS
eukprot:2673825-Rhodomonas_salina.1